MTAIPFSIQASYVSFPASAELTIELRALSDFPEVFYDEDNGAGAINTAHAVSWALAQEQLSRTSVPLDVAQTVFSLNDNGWSPLHDSDLEELSPAARAVVSGLRIALAEAHAIAREQVSSGDLFTGKDCLLGLREGDFVLARTETGDLPCILTEVQSLASSTGPACRLWMAYLAIRTNGKLSWHRHAVTLPCGSKQAVKNAAVVLMSDAQLQHAKGRGQRYMSLVTDCQYARCLGSFKVKRNWHTDEHHLDGRVMADPLGASQSLPRVVGADSAFGPDYPPVPLPSHLGDCVAFTPQWVPGFSFKHKQWGLLSLDDLQDIAFRDGAFEQLVLPAATKETVHALVKHSADTFTDIIDGKSGGCVFLLYGPPGTGKTLTAEAVAEVLHRPLYVINVGELGTTPSELEDALRRALSTAERWNAVVLLDEADIFLERRTSTDIVRNALVGIFLRELEYYRGVLFLTTNRANNLDPAVVSRVSLGLRYESLEREARVQVWKTLASAALGYEPTLSFDEVAHLELNGRQIKNVLRLALTLGAATKAGLTAEHLAQALALTVSFVSDCTPAPFEPTSDNP